MGGAELQMSRFRAGVIRYYVQGVKEPQPPGRRSAFSERWQNANISESRLQLYKPRSDSESATSITWEFTNFKSKNGGFL